MITRDVLFETDRNFDKIPSRFYLSLEDNEYRQEYKYDYLR